MTTTEPEQRHPIYPSLVISEPDDYDEPKAGIVTRLTLSTPESVPVGVLLYNDKGLHWTPADTEDIDAQEHAAELLNFIRGNKGEGVALADAVESIRDAYEGDYVEDQVRFVPGR